MKNLNLGCGQHVVQGWINIDSHRVCECEPCMASGPEIICDIRSLPFGDGEVDAVYAGHVLEHLPLDEVPALLQEIRRVLRPGGKLGIVGPDFDRATAEWPEMCDAIWPGELPGDWPGASHQWCATGPKTLKLVRQVFPAAEEIPIAEIDPFWPAVSFLGWQFAIVSEA